MRKVFISTVPLQRINPDIPYVSEDFELGEKKFSLPITYLIDAETEMGDNIAVITAVMQKEAPQAKYESFVSEVRECLKDREVKIDFIEIKNTNIYDSLSFSDFFKQIASLIEDGDELYADITYGIKCYNIAMFIAMSYATKAARDVSMNTLIYADLYSGDTAPGKQSTIMDVTSLFYLNSITANARPGDKEKLDTLLAFILPDENG